MEKEAAFVCRVVGYVGTVYASVTEGEEKPSEYPSEGNRWGAEVSGENLRNHSRRIRTLVLEQCVCVVSTCLPRLPHVCASRLFQPQSGIGQGLLTCIIPIPNPTTNKANHYLFSIYKRVDSCVLQNKTAAKANFSLFFCARLPVLVDPNSEKRYKSRHRTSSRW